MNRAKRQSALGTRSPKRLAAWLGAVAVGCVGTFAQTPAQLHPGRVLQDGAATLCPGSPGYGYAIPCVTDWNGDGAKDLLVGYQTAGKIALYLNLGDFANPCFTNYTNLKTGVGVEISHPSQGCGAPAPWVCDFDGDGDRDLLVGAGADGTVWLYLNTNTDSSPMLAAGVQLKIGNSVLSVGQRAAPLMHDWDQDGLPDLLCGAWDGSVFFFRNTNSGAAPAFAPAAKVKAGGADLNLGIRSVVRMFDWDGDGLTDLVGSSDTGVYWCRNESRNGQPLLGARQTIRAPVSGSGLTPINTGGRMRLDLVDWNGDGIVDLLLGNLNGTVSRYEGYHFHLRSPIRNGQNISLSWQSAPFLNYRVMRGGAVDALTNIVGSRIVSEGSLTHWTGAATEPSQFYRVQIE